MASINVIGVRVRLATKGSGKWATSGGENAKFACPPPSCRGQARFLHREGIASCRSSCISLGSQITDIARSSAPCARPRGSIPSPQAGARAGLFEWAGARHRLRRVAHDFDSSVNYTLLEYARDVVAAGQEVCDEEKVAHPVLVSESGRGWRHHSVLVVEAFGVIEKAPRGPESPRRRATRRRARHPRHLARSKQAPLESLQDAKEIREKPTPCSASPDRFAGEGQGRDGYWRMRP
jgi:arginine decarboxylase